MKVSVESTYTRTLPQLERLCALARERGLTDDARVIVRESHDIVTIWQDVAEGADQ